MYRISSLSIFSSDKKTPDLYQISKSYIQNVTLTNNILTLGAGPAGLSCASGLARLLHTCFLLSASQLRNDKSKYMHNVLTWEHGDNAEFRSAARKDLLTHYETISFEDDVTISCIEKVGSVFKAVDTNTGKTY
jgi:thioredoxin reductase